MVSSSIKIEKGALELEDGQLTEKWSQTGYALVKSGIIQDIIDSKQQNNEKWEPFIKSGKKGWRFVYEAWAQDQIRKSQKVERLKRGRFYIGVNPERESVLSTHYPLVYVNPLHRKSWLRGYNDVGLVFLGSPTIGELCNLTNGWEEMSEQVANYNWMTQEKSITREWAPAKPNVALIDDEWTGGQQATIETIGESIYQQAGWEFYPVDLTSSPRFGLFNWWW